MSLMKQSNGEGSPMDNPFLTDKIKNRKSIGRNVTKGNFDDIDGGPDIESIYLESEMEADYDDPYHEFDDEDFDQHRAILQFDAKCMDPKAPIIHNLMGAGKEVLDLAINKMGISNPEKLQKLFDEKLKLHPQDKNNIVHKTKEDTKESLICNLSRYAPACLEICLNWRVLILLMIAIVNIMNFLCSLFPCIFITAVYLFAPSLTNYLTERFQTIFRSDSQKVVSVLDESTNVGRELLMKTFQRGDDKVLAEGSGIGLDAMSASSDGTLSSRAYVHGTLSKLRVPRRPASLMSEKDLEVPVSDNRMYLDVRFNDVLTVNCLVDLGATSCSVNRSVLNNIEKCLGYKLPRLKKDFPVMSFAHEKPKRQECVVMNISVENHSFTRNVPFLVNDAQSKVVALLGINVLRYWGVDLSVENEKAIVSFKSKLLPENKITPSIDRDSLNIVLPESITMFPMEAKILTAKIEGKLHQKFGEEFLCIPDFGEESGIAASPFLFKRRGDHVGIYAQNISDFPITLSQDIIIGEISIFDSNSFEKDNSIEGLAKDAFFFKNLPKITIECACDLRIERSIPIIIFTDKYNISPHFHQLTAGDKTLQEYGDMDAYRIDINIIYVKMKDGSYAFDWNILQKYIKTKVRILISFRQEFSSEEKRFLDQLKKKNIFIQVYAIENKICKSCGSLANRSNPQLFKDIDGFKVFIIHGKTQVPDFQRQRDIDSPYIELKLGFYCHLLCFRSEGKLIIYLHMTDWHYDLHRFRFENAIYTLFSHLRILGVPQSFSILTSWDDMKSEESKQIMKAIRLVDPWATNSEFKIEKLKSKSVIAPFLISRCGCYSCRAIIEGRTCLLQKAVMIFAGKLEDVAKSSRVREFDSNPSYKEKLGVRLLEIFDTVVKKHEKLPNQDESLADSSVDMKHPDDQPDWHGQEAIKQAMEHFPAELEAKNIINDRHVPKPWRSTLDESKFDHLKPPIKSKLIEILDRFNDMFSHTKVLIVGYKQFLIDSPLSFLKCLRNDRKVATP